MLDDPISRIEAALAHPALHDEGASLADTWEAVGALGTACNPATIRALLDRLKAAEAEVTWLRDLLKRSLEDPSVRSAVRAALEDTDAR